MNRMTWKDLGRSKSTQQVRLIFISIFSTMLSEDEPEAEVVKPTPRATFLGQKVVKDLIRRRSRLELERAQEAAEKKLQN